MSWRNARPRVSRSSSKTSRPAKLRPNLVGMEPGCHRPQEAGMDRALSSPTARRAPAPVPVLAGIVLTLVGAGGGDEPPKPAALALHGRVFDATTQRPIARFRVILGSTEGDRVRWQGHRITTHEDGRFDFPPNPRAWAETRVRVEAEGYRPGASRVVKKSEGEVSLE